MNLICNMPTDEADMVKLQKEVAKIHSSKIINYISSSSLMEEAKERLLDAIVSGS